VNEALAILNKPVALIKDIFTQDVSSDGFWNGTGIIVLSSDIAPNSSAPAPAPAPEPAPETEPETEPEPAPEPDTEPI
jgi:hypothetical protein